MRKKIVSWLSFMTVFLLTLQSCVHDEMYSPAEKQKQQMVSRSLWKEDTLFIKRIYGHFEKSFMPSDEERNRFTLQYGTPSWEYAMTMGFGKSQLYVPLITGGRVTGMMQVLRQDKKAVYAFTQDPEALDFFETVIYNPRHARLEPQRDQKLSTQHTAKGSYTWTCSKRIVITGWHMEGDTMVMQSSLVEVCKYTYTGMNPVIDHLEVDTDGMESGGGDDEGEEYEGSPCQKLKAQNQNQTFKDKITDLNSKLTLKKETGYVEKINGSYEYKDGASTNANANSLTLGDPTADMKGYLHTHVNDYEDADGNMRIGFKIFSPADVIYFNQMVALAQQNGIPLTDIYAVMVSGTGTYEIRFTGNVNQIKTVYANTKEQYNDMYIKYFLANPKTSDEMNFLKFMDEQMYVKGVSLVKMNSDGTFTTKTLNADKTGVTSVDCPQ